MDNKRINIKEFAKILGVSTATVSRALTGKGRISEKTRKMIREKANELGYRPNVYASKFRTKRSNTIGFFYPSFSSEDPDYFITEIMLGVNESALKLGKNLQIFPITDSPSDENDTIKDNILNGSLEGVIVVAGSKRSAELVETAKSWGVPYIVIGSLRGEKNNTVFFDNEHGARLAGKYFKNIARKHPAYIGGFLDKRKRRGFLEGLGMLEKDVLFDHGGCSFQHGMAAFDRIMQSVPETDCVLCANDVLAIGFIKAAVSKSVKIPEDIAVIGFDDIKMARFYSPSLTTISLHEVEIGRKAMARLMKLLKKEELDEPEFVNCDLIIRESA